MRPAPTFDLRRRPLTLTDSRRARCAVGQISLAVGQSVGQERREERLALDVDPGVSGQVVEAWKTLIRVAINPTGESPTESAGLRQP